MSKGKNSNLFRELSVSKLTKKPNQQEMGTSIWSSSCDFEPKTCLVRDYISKHKLAWWFIENMNNIYFIYGHESSEELCRKKDDIKWDDILPEPLLTMKNERKYFPLGFIMLAPNPENKEVYGIDYIEVFVKGYDIGNKMIDRLYRKLDASLIIPLDISDDETFGYWKKYLRDLFDDEDEFWKSMKEYKIPTDLLIGYDDDPIWESESESESESEMESSPKRIKNE